MNHIEKCSVVNINDKDGNPGGGHVYGVGFHVDWQNGPLGRDENRIDPNGAFVETVISACKQRLEYYQASKFKCLENTVAINALNTALEILDARTAKREENKTEGTHKV